MSPDHRRHSVLAARDLHKSYATTDGSQAVLRGVSLDLAAGESLALTGESGSGKSTLMHVLGLLDTADSGALTLDGDSLIGLDDAGRADLRRSSIGLVFQQFTLVPSLNTRANIALQARLAGRWDAEWGDRLTEALGLSDLADRYPEQLSGGQQQRVAIARALAVRPRVLLADEPTGNLDEGTADRVLDLLLALVDETGAGLLMVTHSTRLAERLDRRLHLTHGRVA